MKRINEKPWGEMNRLYKDEDMRAEDYKFTIRERGEKMNEVKDERKQISVEAGELVVAVDCLEYQISELEKTLNKVLRTKTPTDAHMETGKGLVPLAGFINKERCRISNITWYLSELIKRIEL